MKRNLFLIIACLLVMSTYSEVFGQQSKPRIGITGIQIEKSVFVPNRQEIVGRAITMPDYLSPDSIMGQSAEWLPELMVR